MTFELKKGDLRATARSLGGELVSLRDGDGLEYIWQGDPAFWAGQNPILFPVVGSLKDGKVDIGGKTCEMGRHGFARGLEFAPVEQGEDFVTLELRENEETLMQYPFPFSLKVTHRLLEDGFSTTFTVKNTGTTPMPFCIGAHTAIRCPLQAGERFEDYELLFEEPEQADSLEGMRLLAAEDNEINAEILAELLELEGASCEIVENGRLAVERFQRARPGEFDAILMDVQMPVMNGHEATRAIRAMEREDAKQIPIIAMTANAFAEDEKAALDAGMNAHVAKPLDVELLKRAIRQFVKGKDGTGDENARE